MESEDDSMCGTPPEIADVANSAIQNLLPDKSKLIYEKTYNQFVQWCSDKKTSKVSENTILAYFEDKGKRVKASTLWSIYSMLKSTLNIKENVDIRKFPKLVPYLKRKSVGYRPKKSKIFTREEVNKFITEANDENYLLMKIVLIMGISGACRREELVKMTIDDIEDVGSVLVIKVPDSKTYNQRTFTVTHSDYIELYRKYAALRPSQASNRRFFFKYLNGKCINQVVGINKIGAVPSLIAKYLKLVNAETYTGHCFRRTSATLLADAGASLSTLKRHGRWKSSTVAEGYVEDSLQNKIKISDKIFNCETKNIKMDGSSSSLASSSGVYINNCSNCTITLNVTKN